MTIAGYKVLVDWNNDGDFSDSNEDITGDVMGFDSVRGRNYASQLTGRSIAGALTVELDNSSDKYNSFNTGSALTGNILPGRKVQIQYSGSTFPYTFPVFFDGAPLWTGFLQRIDPKIDQRRRKTATLIAFGPLAKVNQKKVRVEMQTSYRTDLAIGKVLDDVQWPADDRDLSTGNTTMTRWFVNDDLGLEALRNIEGSEMGFIWETVDGKIAFNDRKYRLRETKSITSQATFSDAGGSALTYSTLDQNDPLKEIFNLIEVDIQNYTVGSLATLWILSETGANSPAIGAGDTRVWWAQYPNPDSATNAISVNAWTTLVENTDYEANTAADGSGSDGSGSLTVTLTKYSNRMRIQIANGHASTLYITKLQARGTPVTKDDTATIIAEDSTSQGLYGERTHPVNAPFVPSTTEAVSYTEVMLSIYKDPIPVLRMGVIGNQSDATMVQCFTREINDRITLTATNSVGFGINEDFYVEAIRHTVDAQRRHFTRFDLSPVNDFAGFWVLDVSQLGGGTRLMY